MHQATLTQIRDFLRLLRDFKATYEIKHWSVVARIGGAPRTTMADWVAKRNRPSLENIVSVTGRIEAAQLGRQLLP